jgi:hypothetical protein
MQRSPGVHKVDRVRALFHDGMTPLFIAREFSRGIDSFKFSQGCVVTTVLDVHWTGNLIDPWN